MIITYTNLVGGFGSSNIYSVVTLMHGSAVADVTPAVMFSQRSTHVGIQSSSSLIIVPESMKESDIFPNTINIMGNAEPLAHEHTRPRNIHSLSAVVEKRN
jgi:hypothetical protein